MVGFFEGCCFSWLKKIDDTQKMLSAINATVAESKRWASHFGLTEESGAAFYALFSGIRSAGSLGVKGKPFFIKHVTCYYH